MTASDSTSEYTDTNGIKLHTVFAGPEDGEPVFLLHGFPDAWFGWKAQIDALADAGFRVIAPDQRGYNLSDKPSGVSNYEMATLAADILGLADALGYQCFHVTGHDFGAMVTWTLAMRHPGRLRRIAVANVPHPAVMRSYLRTHVSQMRKSWHMFFFQLPGLPERFVKANNWRFLISAMPDDLTDQERDRYRASWSQPNSMTSMINWYRASFGRSRNAPLPTKIQVPTLVLWGKQDPHISYEMAPLSVELCEQGRLVTFEDAAHWVMRDRPGEVSRLLIEHFSADEP